MSSLKHLQVSVLFLLVLVTTPFARAQTFVSVESDLTWQSKNDQRVPGDGGTLFSIADFNKGPFPAYRIYLGRIWDKKHELRALYAPLAVEVDGRLPESVFFNGTTFAAGTDTKAYYKFNSYRLTYAYHFAPSGEWRFALGFTGKIRDAEVRLTQGALTASKANIGFVPLLNFQAERRIGQKWGVRFDLDGLAAPQGRAFDAGLFLERAIIGSTSGAGLTAFLGYRTIEGGADNKEVYNFAWFHKAVLGLRGEF